MKINYGRILVFLLLGSSGTDLTSEDIKIVPAKASAAALVQRTDGETSRKKQRQKVMLITIPKSGTHLLEKCLYFMDPENLPYNYNEDFRGNERWRKNKQMSLSVTNHWKGVLHPSVLEESIDGVKSMVTNHRSHYKSHIYYTDDYANFLDNKNFKKILLLRDPRAVLVSFANMVKEGFEPGHKIDFEDLLLDLIDGRQKNYIPWASSRHPAYPFIWEVGMTNFYQLYLPFMATKNCLTIHFEALVGEKGGGNQQLQTHEINRIANHLGISLSDKTKAKMLERLFGKSATFYQGTIDGWKKYFTPKVKQAFKDFPEANKLLIKLGYEQSFNW